MGKLRLGAGGHNVAVHLRYRGFGYGVFSYLHGYRFDVRSSHTFTLKPGNAAAVLVRAFVRGDVTTPLEKRPAVDIEVRPADLP